MFTKDEGSKRMGYIGEGDLPERYDELSSEHRTYLQDWIKANIRAAREECPTTSYGMKHYFERSDNGFYITNGQFKGAMLEAGYKPIDPHEQNWTFKVHFMKEPDRHGSGGSFYEWLRTQTERNDPVGHIATDAVHDKEWPVESNDHSELREFVESRSFDNYIRDAFEQAWQEWAGLRAMMN
jgi:uncharacterized protein YozE (UPF0346 family)